MLPTMNILLFCLAVSTHSEYHFEALLVGEGLLIQSPSNQKQCFILLFWLDNFPKAKWDSIQDAASVLDRAGVVSPCLHSFKHSPDESPNLSSTSSRDGSNRQFVVCSTNNVHEVRFREETDEETRNDLEMCETAYALRKKISQVLENPDSDPDIILQSGRAIQASLTPASYSSAQKNYPAETVTFAPDLCIPALRNDFETGHLKQFNDTELMRLFDELIRKLDSLEIADRMKLIGLCDRNRKVEDLANFTAAIKAAFQTIVGPLVAPE